jgi:UDP-N-acetyl-D-glucosamine dehydrogenase
MKPDVAVIGAGYVGMPLAKVFAEAGKNVLLRDVVAEVVEGINRGESHIGDVSSAELEKLVDAGRVRATLQMDVAAEADAILIALPTPLSSQREPDLSIVQQAVEELAPHLRKGHLVVLESTTYPGTTREVIQPILERGGLKAGEDFHLAFSPERVDPGRTDWTTHNTPKVVGGVTPACTERAAELYRGAVETVVPVSSPEAAELTKLLENIFRAVNIALVNELAQLCERMDIDVWEVVRAAETKPFGFMSFKPGPGQINANMPYFCRSLISQALNHGAQKSLNGARLLVLGVSYKADVDDVRESPAEKIIQLLQKAGAEVSYHDPYVAEFDGMHSVEYEPEGYDGVVIVTAHSAIDYDDLVERAQIVVDFRNATGRNGTDNEKVWKL